MVLNMDMILNEYDHEYSTKNLERDSIVIRKHVYCAEGL